MKKRQKEKQNIDEKLKAKNKPGKKVMRKKHGFGIAIIIYVILWIIASVVVWKYLWNRLDVYQKGYEEAQQMANPDLVIGDYLDLFTRENIESLAGDEWNAISPYEKRDNIDAFIASFVDDEALKWVRRSDFTDLKPKYDIYSGESHVGAVSLKQKKEVDEYGFRKCELNRAEVAFAPEDLKTVRISAYEGALIYLNDILLTEECIESVTLDGDMDTLAAEDTGNEIRINTYEVTGFLDFPKVEIKREGFVCDVEESVDCETLKSFKQITMYDPLLLEEVHDRALDIARAYDLYAAGIREIGSMGQYFIYSERGYKTLAGLAFDISIAGTTTTYDIISADTGNLIAYAEDALVIDTYQQIHRVHRNIEYDEDINIRWYLINKNGKWYVKNFSMRL